MHHEKSRKIQLLSFTSADFEEMSSLLMTIIVSICSISCSSIETKLGEKVVGVWTIESISNIVPNSNLYEGTIISFTKDREFRGPRINAKSPRIGKWYVHEADGNYLLNVDFHNPYISGEYEVDAFIVDNKKPNSIKLNPVDTTKESLRLVRINTSLDSYIQ